MKISEHTIDALVQIIAGDRSLALSPYRSGSELVKFFNNLGWNDTYGEGFPTRSSYVREKIMVSNGTTKLRSIVNAAVDPREYFATDFDVRKSVDHINYYLIFDGYNLQQDGPAFSVNTVVGISTKNKKVKNLVFAATGPKPEIVLTDLTTNEIKIVKNKQYCLVYDREILDEGLAWNELMDWWKEKSNQNQCTPGQIHASLVDRLFRSLQSEPEKILFMTYYRPVYSLFQPRLGNAIPALVPQIYLHYDPYTIKQLAGEKRLGRQRMDFLILFPKNKKVVIEIDGKQHYSIVDDKTKLNIANPSLYAEMVREDRRLKLAGYEIFRFGGAEFTDQQEATKALIEFFSQLLELHGSE